MKIGMFTANYMDRDLESVLKLMAEHGYEMAEPTESAQVVQLGKIPSVSGTLPSAAAPNCPQPVHVVALT